MNADQIDDRINAGPISGFPEWSPAERILEQRMLDRIREVFERFGFSPIETPAVERNAALTAKGGAETERQIYGLTGLHPQSGGGAREYSLHFDLTVPLARYVAQRSNDLVFPFRRYQMQKVWRGERPQHGRFREFMQCDIDIVGDGKLSLMADAEIPAVIYNVFTDLDIGAFTIRISNRKILTGYLESLGFDERDTADILREADKIDRQGADPLLRHLESLSVEASVTEGILALVEMEGSSAEILDNLTAMRDIGERFALGVDELKTVFASADEESAPRAAIRFPPFATTLPPFVTPPEPGRVRRDLRPSPSLRCRSDPARSRRDPATDHRAGLPFPSAARGVRPILPSAGAPSGGARGRLLYPCRAGGRCRAGEAAPLDFRLRGPPPRAGRRYPDTRLSPSAPIRST